VISQHFIDRMLERLAQWWNDRTTWLPPRKPSVECPQTPGINREMTAMLTNR